MTVRYKASEKKALKEWYKLDSRYRALYSFMQANGLPRHEAAASSARKSGPVGASAARPECERSVASVPVRIESARFQDSIMLMIATCRKALFLRRLSRREEAIESALLSIASYPWNWATWILLSECMDDGEEVCRPDDDDGEADVSSLQLSALLPLLPLPPTHPVVQMFQIKTLNTLNNPSENELGLCDKLLHEDRFPRSLWIMSLRACVLYHLHGEPSHLHHRHCSHTQAQTSGRPKRSSRKSGRSTRTVSTTSTSTPTSSTWPKTNSSCPSSRTTSSDWTRTDQRYAA